jgi:hypothetical protein
MVTLSSFIIRKTLFFEIIFSTLKGVRRSEWLSICLGLESLLGPMTIVVERLRFVKPVS